MATFNSMLSAPVSIAAASDTNADVVVTVSAPADAVRNTIAVYGVMITQSDVAAAGIAVLLKDGADTILTIEVGTVLASPIYIPFPANHPYIATAGNDVTLTVPALGAAVVGTGAIFYAYVTV